MEWSIGNGGLTCQSYTWETVVPDDKRWRPEPGFRSEKGLDAYWMCHPLR